MTAFSRVRFAHRQDAVETKLEYSAIAVPITFQGKDGKQYVAVVAGNGGAGVTDPDPRGTESLVVFAVK